jgi:NDP-sugar pyrophosphorylase family protein
MKYRLTQSYIGVHRNKFLYQIEALKDFGYVKKGDLGGYVESEDNLSQEGNCWLYKGSMVIDTAHVFGNAYVENSIIFNNARIFDDAYVFGAEIGGEVVIEGNSRIGEGVLLTGSIHLTNGRVFALGIE